MLTYGVVTMVKSDTNQHQCMYQYKAGLCELNKNSWSVHQNRFRLTAALKAYRRKLLKHHIVSWQT